MSKTKPPPAKAAPTEAAIAKRDAAALARVATMDDPDGLRNLMANAERLGVEPVRAAAFRRLAAVQSEGEEGSVENATWQMIHAVEQIKREAAGKTIRLSYLRRDIEKVGAAPAIGKLVSKPGPSERFDELMERGEPTLTAEAIVLAHPDDFDDETRAAATSRLEGAGVDVASLSP
ncbi:hypothetical protein [uncultured Jannaschia sp.]|uniref:hypothetical protein n=1 Tax=uncultured Jannaschia sp. TaxID=293347 RepID=UPI0026379F40|nr:hypothetical protein [uncultured Jannaschia sp.]